MIIVCRIGLTVQLVCGKTKHKSTAQLAPSEVGASGLSGVVLLCMSLPAAVPAASVSASQSLDICYTHSTDCLQIDFNPVD